MRPRRVACSTWRVRITGGAREAREEIERTRLGPQYSGPCLVLIVAALTRGCVERFARTRARRHHRHGPGVHALAAILRQRSGDGDLLTDLQRLTTPAAALQTVRRSHLGAPVRHLTRLGILH